MARVQLKEIDKVYANGVHALKKLSLDIEDGTFLVLVGPSGCGKSTALRVIAGLEDITAGQLEIGETVVNNVLPKDRNIAMVFQNYALYPTMTVYQNMALGLELRKVPKSEIREKVQAVAETLGIVDLLKRKPDTMSGGQRQRVALGRAMVRNPEVFLLDEPLSNLDAKLRTQMRVEIAKLHRTLRKTFVYVTHDQVEAMTMGDKIAVLNEGVLQQVDTPQTVYEKPANLFVAGFIGTPQMNFLSAQVVAEENIIKILVCGGEIVLGQCETLEAYVGQQVVLGIRSEDVKIAERGIAATHEFTELLGGEALLYLKADGQSLVLKTSSQQIPKENSFYITLQMEKIHLFDQNTGIRIER